MAAGTEDADTLQAQIRALGEEVRKLTAMLAETGEAGAAELRAALSGKAEEWAGLADDIAHRAGKRARSDMEAIERHIAERPLQSALIALILGLMLGALMRR